LTTYTKQQIQELLEQESWEYHRVDLPYALNTPGPDRRSTADIIFTPRLDGKTVLDVGCALGYFCFEAERRGASRVVGIELKDSRYRQALLLKDIKDSRVEFLQRDAIASPPEDQFDYVCCLNVIHHLKEPFYAVRSLSRITRERLILEFPTFSDAKFRRHARMFLSPIYNRRPLVGVSSVADRATDQTFIFSPVALRRVLMDHDRLFRDVEFIGSPIKGRMIAVCTV
jgi:2-polyprenyl-3-methyl-5-hydroxy-6-metoxy-1,4-benzoquinol methylase